MPELAARRPLGLRSDLVLSTEQFEMMQKIEGQDLWYVEERLERKSLVVGGEIAQAVLEFKRYMALVGLGYRGLGMLSPEIDEVWHAFILFTREYAAFCQDVFGEFIHHVPRTSRSSTSDTTRVAFLAAYDEVFGESARAHYAEEWAAAAKMGDEPSGCGTEDCTSG